MKRMISRRPAGPARARRLLFAALAALLFLSLAELLSFLGLGLLDRKLGLRTVRFSRDAAFEELSSGKGHFVFDRELGWDTPGVVRGKDPPAAGELRFASAYGDSFTYCAESADAETWESRFEQATGRRILNLGVNAYGTDQALLKIEKYYPRYPTRVVILGILGENICRLGSVVRNFYQRDDPFPHVKPRYRLGARGGLELLANPISRVEELDRLLDPRFLASIAPGDFWYGYYRDRYGFDSVYGRRFPSLLDVARIVRGLFRYGRRGVDTGTLLACEGCELSRIMQEILLSFRRDADRRGYSPVVLIHTTVYDLAYDAAFAKLVRFARERARLPVLDLVGVLGRAAREREIRPASLFRTWHYAPAANRIVAEALEKLMAGLGLLGEGGGR